jgi:outer membrane protein OmpA-like peptidoglycan-associated protein
MAGWLLALACAAQQPPFPKENTPSDAAEALADTIDSRGPSPATGAAQQRLKDQLVAHFSLRARSFGIAEAEQRSVWLPVRFAYNRADLSAGTQAALQAMAQAMNAAPVAGNSFLIRGHTDHRGSAGYNMDLAMQRARSVRSFLTADGGVVPRRLCVAAVGKAEPAAGTVVSQSDEERAINRRVEIWILPSSCP